MLEFGLIVIGAHTGIHIIDEIEKFHSENILLVEPVPHNVEAMKKNLSKYKNIIIEPIAIGNHNEFRNFYFIRSESVTKLKKHWASGIGSFDKNHIYSHKTKRFKVEEEDIEEIKIKCMTFSDLLKKYSISSIKKLLMDVEGSEYEILNDINFDQINIGKILFEYKHFDGHFKKGEKLDKIKKKLESHSYKLTTIDEENMLAEKI